MLWLRESISKTFSPVAQLEAIRLWLGIAYVNKIILFQMDVKSAFLNGYILEEVYVAQLKGFVDPINQEYGYKLHKALYGLKQVSKA